MWSLTVKVSIEVVVLRLFLGDDLKILGLPLFSKAISLNKLVQFFFLQKNLYSRFAPGKTEDKAILVY